MSLSFFCGWLTPGCPCGAGTARGPCPGTRPAPAPAAQRGPSAARRAFILVFISSFTIMIIVNTIIINIIIVINVTK